MTETPKPKLTKAQREFNADVFVQKVLQASIVCGERPIDRPVCMQDFINVAYAAYVQGREDALLNESITPAGREALR